MFMLYRVALVLFTADILSDVFLLIGSKRLEETAVLIGYDALLVCSSSSITRSLTFCWSPVKCILKT